MENRKISQYFNWGNKLKIDQRTKKKKKKKAEELLSSVCLIKR